MHILDKKEIKERFFSSQTQPRNFLGQNYLVSLYGMTTFLQYLHACETVLEIGPGIGNITINYLHNAKKIILVEIDSEKIPILKKVLSDANEGVFPDWVTIINDDILKVTIDSLFDTTNPYQIIGALPYNIAKRIIHQTLQLFPSPLQALFIVQKEVADKYISETKSETFLSVSSKLYATIERKEILPAHYFFPTPKVRSRIIKITGFNASNPSDVINFEKESQFIKKGFANPRKKLSNTLDVKNYTPDIIFAKDKRAEEISLNTWHQLYKIGLLENALI